MGNANGREEEAGGGGTDEDGSNRDSPSVMQIQRPPPPPNPAAPVQPISNNNNNTTPPHSPARSASPLLFAPQVPVVPVQKPDGFPLQLWPNEPQPVVVDQPSVKGIPTLIIWTYGGNEVAVEGSWDNWQSRKLMQRSGKDHSILLVLPSGIYHYKFIIDGEWRYTPDLPCVADEMGRVCNILDVNESRVLIFSFLQDYVPENPDSVSEFEAPASPDSSYGNMLPSEEEFAKEPVIVPPQLHLTVLGMENSGEPVSTSSSPSKPQHVVLNHLFIEKGWASQSLVGLGLTHRFESKYVTVVLYKPLKR
ncbi:SNF1-related protein kinase regulatory subunit beta-1 [Linum perenne]